MVMISLFTVYQVMEFRLGVGWTHFEGCEGRFRSWADVDFVRFVLPLALSSGFCWARFFLVKEQEIYVADLCILICWVSLKELTIFLNFLCTHCNTNCHLEVEM